MHKDWQEIDLKLHGAVTATTFAALFIGDQIYNHVIDLKEKISKSKLFKHSVKYSFKKMEEESLRYNANVFVMARCNKESYAEITMLMEEHCSRHIEIYGYSVSQHLLKNGISGELNSLLTSALVINMLSQASNVAIKELKDRLWSIDVDVNPLSYLNQERMDKLSMNLVHLLSDKDINLNDCETIRTSFIAFANGLFKKEMIEKLLEI